MSALLNSEYSGHCKSTEEEGDQRTCERSGERNMDCGFEVKLQEDGSGNSRQSWMETSCVWSVFHWEWQSISHYSLTEVNQIIFSVWKMTCIVLCDVCTVFVSGRNASIDKPKCDGHVGADIPQAWRSSHWRSAVDAKVFVVWCKRCICLSDGSQRWTC